MFAAGPPVAGGMWLCRSGRHARHLMVRERGVRAVVCRDGVAILIFQTTNPTANQYEEKAGGRPSLSGFFGVSGNLNLSRSIGDLKYKQSTNRRSRSSRRNWRWQHKLDPKDEFLIVACDGQDVLSNQEAGLRADSHPGGAGAGREPQSRRSRPCSTVHRDEPRKPEVGGQHDLRRRGSGGRWVTSSPAVRGALDEQPGRSR